MNIATVATVATAPALTINSKISAKRLANAAKRRDAGRAGAILAKAYTAAAVEQEATVTDSAGRIIRQTPATKAEIASFLRGNRVVDTFDILETVGETAFNTLVANGTLVRDASFSRFKKNNLYWVSERAIELYGLPSKITIMGGLKVAYAAA